MFFIILPNHLFDVKYLSKEHKYIIWEHPHFFTNYNFNKKKLMLHRASMRYYYDYLKNKDYTVKYVSFNQKISDEATEYKIFDPIDKIKINLTNMVESPNFLLKKTDYEQYRNKTDKFFFSAFYMYGKKIINVIPNIKSQDKLNREKMPKSEYDKLSGVIINKKDEKYINEAKKYVEKYFPNNCGNTDNFYFPISHQSAKKWLTDFLKNKLKKFGKYQDFIHKDYSLLYHSCLSSSINIGLLNPLEIIDEIKLYKSKVPLSSYEGYIRQLFWREYQRYCYIYCDFDKNYFGNNKKLDVKWYNGTLNVEPVDDCIKKAFNNSYLNHIERLMVVGNFMNLSGISPKQGFKWFMEFSIDSYEWVMCQNVYDMVFFVTGGKTMRKPYVSSGNYVYNMSNYDKGEWFNIWNNLYRKFVKKQRKKLYKFRYSFPSLKQ